MKEAGSARTSEEIVIIVSINLNVNFTPTLKICKVGINIAAIC